MKNLLVLLLFIAFSAHGQSYVTRDIKSFGAKGDGKTNDHDAFVMAADFFNKRGGNGKLIISRGIYLVGKQRSRLIFRLHYHLPTRSVIFPFRFNHLPT